MQPGTSRHRLCCDKIAEAEVDRVAFALGEVHNQVRIHEYPRTLRRQEKMPWSPAEKWYPLLRAATLAALVHLAGFIACTTIAAEPTEQPFEHRFAEVVHPFLKNY